MARLESQALLPKGNCLCRAWQKAERLQNSPKPHQPGALKCSEHCTGCEQLLLLPLLPPNLCCLLMQHGFHTAKASLSPSKFIDNEVLFLLQQVKRRLRVVWAVSAGVGQHTGLPWGKELFFQTSQHRLCWILHNNILHFQTTFGYLFSDWC